MVTLTVSDLHTAFNWAANRASASRNSCLFGSYEAEARNIHDAYIKAAAGCFSEITCKELSDVESVALDIELGSLRGTPRHETAKAIFQKAVDSRIFLEREGR